VKICLKRIKEHRAASQEEEEHWNCPWTVDNDNTEARISQSRMESMLFNEIKNCEKAMGLMPNYFLQIKIFLNPPKNVHTNKLYFYWSLISLFSMRNIAANHYVTVLD